MSAARTPFRALRNFWFAGRDVAVGERLELTDEEARLLVSLGDTVEPINGHDQKLVVRVGRVQWGAAKDEAAPAWRTRDDFV